jgi:hypothetical protein
VVVVDISGPPFGVVVSFHALVAIAALTANRPAVRTRLWPGAAVAAAGLIIKAPELFASQVLRLLIRRNVLLCFIAVTPTINYPDSARLRGAGRGLLLVYK